MKTVARIASLLLALVMVFGLSVTAFAAETGTITVDNPIAAQTYTAYKIFDVVYDAEGHYSYTIDSSNEWFTTVQAYATEANGLTLTQANGSTTYIVTTTNAFSAPDFAVALKAAVTGKTGGITLNVADGKATATGLDLGLIEEGKYYDPMMNIRVFTCYIAKVKDASNVETVKTGFEKCLKAQQDAFAQYLPDQYELALKGQVVVEGNYVMLAILEDTPAAVSAFQSLLK